ncbi:hypothetical protein ACFQJD_01365 [Haloplanus sp. GCM10025708]|uniref:hypothetical protein n=1 Tax=Haloplanus sp. GCM10025708 TaxID=3252679 RepID=UPI003620E311
MEHHPVRADQPEVGTGGEYTRRLMHHVFVRDVGIGEHDRVHFFLVDGRLEVRFGADRDALWIALTGQLRGIAAVREFIELADVLRAGVCERDDVEALVASKDGIEVVEVAARCTHDDDSRLTHSTNYVWRVELVWAAPLTSRERLRSSWRWAETRYSVSTVLGRSTNSLT